MSRSFFGSKCPLLGVVGWLGALALTGCSNAAVDVPRFFADGMVVQRQMPIPVWGRAKSGAKVTVRMADAEVVTRADADGNWRCELPAMEAGGPYTLQVNDSIYDDVLVGDVYLCSGQSNMELTVDWIKYMYEREIESDSNTMVRHFNVPQVYDFQGPCADFSGGEWVQQVPDKVGPCSSLAYFFAKEMQTHLQVPIGIINASLGGSPIESWMSQENLREGGYTACVNEAEVLKDTAYVQGTVRAERRRGEVWTAVANASDPGMQASPSWTEQYADDATWPVYNLYDTSWQRDAHGARRLGTYWMRRHFDAPGIDPQQAAKLQLGMMQGCDSVWVNGTLVGTSGYYHVQRNYDIPAGVLTEKDNVVAVRVLLTQGAAEVTREKPHLVEQGAQVVSLEGDWKFHWGAVMPKQAGETFFRWKPTCLYNAMIAPLRGLHFKGILWYQGEANTGRAYEYADLLERMIAEWRGDFGQPELPFYTVLLANYTAAKPEPGPSGWAEVRDAMIKVARKDHKVGLGNAIDIGFWNDIHPYLKKELAHRLVLEVRRICLGEDLVSRGPEFYDAIASGNKMLVSFKRGTGILESNSDLKGFAVAGADGKFVWARAMTLGNQVIAWSDKVPNPKYVSYAWADNPQPATLRNIQGLTALPFNTKY